MHAIPSLYRQINRQPNWLTERNWGIILFIIDRYFVRQYFDVDWRSYDDIVWA